MLIDLLEDPHEIRRICIMGRNCTLDKSSDDMECAVPLEKHIAEGTAEINHYDVASSVLQYVILPSNYLHNIV